MFEHIIHILHAACHMHTSGHAHAHASDGEHAMQHSRRACHVVLWCSDRRAATAGSGRVDAATG